MASPVQPDAPPAATADLVDRTLDPRVDDEASLALVDGWLHGTSRGFHDGRPGDEERALWLRCARADAAELRGLWEPSPPVGSGTLPVATISSWDGTLHAGAGLLPLRLITDVTVAPTHRRRGLLRELLGEELAATARRSVPVAALTVSEGTIYGRFGFGPATRKRSVEVDVGDRFALHGPAAAGRVVLVEPAEAEEVLAAVAQRHHETTRATVSRPAFYREVLAGRLDPETRGEDRKLRVAVHLDEAGTPDGYVAWRHRGEVEGRGTLDVADLLALSPATHLALWRFLASLDLTERVRWRGAPVVDPLDHAVVDPRAVRTVGTTDVLWLRVLDPVAALAARPWRGDGRVVPEVDDALGHAAGRFAVTVRAGRAEVERLDDASGAGDLRLDVAVLGTLLLGDVDVATLADARRVVGSDAAVSAYAAVGDLAAPPWCPTGF